MDESTVNWLKEHGYMKYADEPFEKWYKELDGFILKIRTTSLAESKLYGMKLAGKAGRKDGPLFDATFSVFFGNEPDRLDEEMMKDIANK